MSRQTIAERGIPKHRDEIDFLTSLLIDLKKRELGHELREPITMDRLTEASKCVSKLFYCRERVVFR